ncbi:hypothetical protein HYT18_00765 [Candidatus Microgenomates bacterium]|nr:hypothetical protein [Candidatus Microgenomates bacterium]
MSNIVSVFQLGSSTVVTLPKKLGFKPGQKLEVKKSKNGATLKLEKKKTLLEILEETRGAWAGGTDWEDYQKRRKLEIAAAKKMRKAW